MGVGGAEQGQAKQDACLSLGSEGFQHKGAQVIFVLKGSLQLLCREQTVERLGRARRRATRLRR